MGKVFYANFFYELFGNLKEKVSIQNLFEDGNPSYLDISAFPDPPDTIVKYIY